MGYCWIESPHNTIFESIIAYNRIKRSARWPKEHTHSDEKLIIYFTWPNSPLRPFPGSKSTDAF